MQECRKEFTEYDFIINSLALTHELQLHILERKIFLPLPPISLQGISIFAVKSKAFWYTLLLND